MFDYNSTPKEHWPYYLYLEGIANELMHVIQQKRKEIKLQLVDWIDVVIDEVTSTQLTSACMQFGAEIKERCRIKIFAPNPASVVSEGTRLWKDETIDSQFHKLTYNLYIRKCGNN